MGKTDINKIIQSIFEPKKIRRYLVYAILLIIGYIIDPKTFMLALLMIGTVVGKVIRAKIADNMFMFDPLVFFSILIIFFPVDDKFVKTEIDFK